MQKPVFVPDEILLPAHDTDLSKWAVMACDQFTSQPEYWDKVEEIVAEAPSTLRIILPEVYLEQDGVQVRIEAIHKAMEAYREDRLTERVHGYVYVERETSTGIRQGLVGCVDLDAYSYEKGAQPRCRPSENTVVERIPPRLAVRRGAALESPHILMLVDDPAATVIEPLAAKKDDLPLLYNVDLMLGGGKLKGWAVTSPADIAAIDAAITALEEPAAFEARYHCGDGTCPFPFAVGDGNHSLATAKALWEEIKSTLSEEERGRHPARLCLVELENIQSPAIAIEPIHRVVFGLDGEALLRAVNDYCRENGVGLEKDGNLAARNGSAAPSGLASPAAGASCFASRSQQAAISMAPGEQNFTVLYGDYENQIGLHDAREPLAVGSVEAILAVCAQEHPGMRVDYVHGDDSVRQLVADGAAGILLPPFEKADLFRGVALGGVLPKKTFSMGHAEEKRYYMECRKIL